VSKKRFNSVIEMVRETTDDETFADELESIIDAKTFRDLTWIGRMSKKLSSVKTYLTRLIRLS